MTLRSILIISALVMGGAIFGAYQPNTYGGGDDKEREKKIIEYTLRLIEARHFNPKAMDDAFSRMAFKTYIDRLDGAKRFLTIEQYDLLDDYEEQIDDALRRPNLEFFDLSYELIQNAQEKVRTMYPDILSRPFDFTIEEDIELDGENLEFAKDDAELRERWEHYLKYETLTRLADKLDEQEKEEDPEGGKKSLTELEQEARTDVAEMMDDWFKRFDEARRSDHFELYLNSITNTFDPHTDYFNPKRKDDFDITMSGRLEGIGARLQRDGSYTKVVSIVPGGPAWKQGDLEVEDVIYAVKQDGEEPVDINGMHIDDVVSMIRGDKETFVTLTVKKVSGEMMDIRIQRDEVILDEGLVRSVILKSPGKVDKVGYIQLPRFYADFENPDGRSCAEDVSLELEKLKDKNVDGIILDLRNNSGGSLNDVVEMSGLFIKSGPIVQVKSRDDEPYVFRDKDPEVRYSGPLIIMVNKYSASASEIIAAALQDYGRAVIVGSTSTFGKGTVQRFYDLDRISRADSEFEPLGDVKLTMQKFYRIDGGSTQLKGVTPDIILPDRYQYVDIGEKKLDYPMSWTKIAPVTYSQDVSDLSQLNSIVKKSGTRVSESPVFAKVEENAKRIERNRDHSVYSLQLDSYRSNEKARREEAKEFKNMFPKIENLMVENLPEDLESINLDSTRIGRNEEWIKGIRKDAYIDECISIMQDMIYAGVALVDPKRP